MTLIMIMLAVIGGATLSMQAAINGQLGSKVGGGSQCIFNFFDWSLDHWIVDFLF